jgi:alkyl sulfatase BDS1-like metallo-beta-lactamase superfamily hydrolase
VLQRSRFGDVDQAIGKTIASGSMWLIAPNRI